MQIIRSQSVLMLAEKFMYCHFLAGMGSFKQLLDLRKGKVGVVRCFHCQRLQSISTVFPGKYVNILRASLLGVTTGLFDGAVSENVKDAWRDM